MQVGSGSFSRIGRCGLALMAVTVPVAGREAASQQPAADTASASGTSLARQVEAILAEPAVARAHWGIAVRTMEGKSVFSRNDAQLFQPASTAKLFTTAAAVALLGPERTWRTRVLARGAVNAEGELRGDLVLAGAGDANLSGRVLPYLPPSERAVSHAETDPAAAADPVAPLAAMADAVAATGIKRVTGDVLGDDSLFPADPYAIGWELDDLTWGYGAPVSALSVADNQLRLTITPGARAGQPAAVVVAQAVPYYVLEAMVMTSPPRSTSGGVQVERSPGQRALRVYGQIAADAGVDTEEIAISDPAEYASMVFKAMLETRGIAVAGSAVALHRHPVEARGFLAQSHEPVTLLTGHAAEKPGGAVTGQGCPQCDARPALPETSLAEHRSPSLIDDVVLTNKTSQNLHAELLLRQLGRAWGEDGSAAQGSRVVRQFLLDAGIGKDDFVLYDGSGLSGHDLVTPRAETGLLLYAARQPWFAAWKRSLPVGGVDGTLQARFVHEPLKGHVFAKTGTLGEARALAGYVVCASGQTVIVAILDGAHLPGSNADRDAMDRIIAAVAATN